MHVSLKCVENSREERADQSLALMVRLQLITEKVFLSDWYDSTFDQSQDRQVLQPMYTQALQSQLHEILTKVPDHIRNDTTVLAHIHTVEMTIDNIATTHVSAGSTGLSFQQIKRLNSIVRALKAWVGNFFTVPRAKYVGLPFSIISQLVRCLGLLFHLSSLDVPGWPAETARGTVDVIDITARVADNMEQVFSVAGIDNTESPDGDVFLRTAKRFRAMSSKWSEKLCSIENADQNEALIVPDSLDFDWSDNSWMMDFAMMPDYYHTRPI